MKTDEIWLTVEFNFKKKKKRSETNNCKEKVYFWSNEPFGAMRVYFWDNGL